MKSPSRAKRGRRISFTAVSAVPNGSHLGAAPSLLPGPPQPASRTFLRRADVGAELWESWFLRIAGGILLFLAMRAA